MVVLIGFLITVLGVFLIGYVLGQGSRDAYLTPDVLERIQRGEVSDY